MAPVALSPDEQMAAMEAGSSEMKFQLARDGVKVGTQAILFHFGAVTLPKFAAFFRDADEVRKVAKEELGIDPDAGLAFRSELAGLICSWESAGVRTRETLKYMGELDARKQTKPLMGSDYLVMRNSFEKKFFKLDDTECPARVYIERRVSEMEAGEMRAEALKTVLNRDQDGEEALVPTWDNTGGLKLKRTSCDIEEPTNPEELRRRISVMINGLIFISLQHTNREGLQGIRPELANTYSNFLLGDQVWALIAQDEQGRTIATPNWRLVLQYEYNIRKKAYQDMTELGTSFAVSLKDAWHDVFVRNRYFITPLAISSSSGSKAVEISSSQSSGAKRPANDGETGNDRGNRKAGRGRGKGKSKGGKRLKPGGKSLEVPKGCARTTPDGRFICYGYNDFSIRCRNPQCQFIQGHVCGICFQKHPMYSCQGKQKFAQEGSKPETQGSK